MDERVVITGIGIVSGFGMGKQIFWDNLATGKSAISITEADSIYDLDKYYSALVPEFSAKDYLPLLRPPYPNRYSLLAMIAAANAIQDAKINETEIDPIRIGTVLSTDFGPNETVERYLLDLFKRGPGGVSPLLFSRTVSNVALGEIARYFRLKGASSLLIGDNSICYAFDLLQDGKADIILCGGVDELRNIIIWAYGKLEMLASLSGDPQSDIQPYLGKSSGIVLGEGAAFLILERHEHAMKRKANIYAEIAGTAILCDRQANHFYPDRTIEDLAIVMSQAMQEAGHSISDPICIFGSASSHPFLGNREIKACEEVWNNGQAVITSIKGYTGETFGASATLNVGAAALALFHKRIPCCGTAPVENSGPIEVITGDARPATMNTCICNSIHLGGNNISVVLTTYS